MSKDRKTWIQIFTVNSPQVGTRRVALGTDFCVFFDETFMVTKSQSWAGVNVVWLS